ncbi:uroporphyrinogen-III synthase [Janthinobacterium sp. 17J80-10]|uniref:uroporphyrinogen-III synthase n=1 Tax=Janthinobacterium sp. 17J80-10 TaxID=2497863 RepID=UPI0010056EBA|nr:uroporphyrinogen-III synthase [Janthinobacterium sp. 17J80-10]QAU34814.1 uroporphyrinogen III synthase [Janthinobacterium sp. 17J80-10]
MPRPVVITRPAAQAGELASLVAALGREAVLFPLLEIHPLPDPAPLQAALAALERYALVAFVSPNAIDAAFAARPMWPAGMTLAVVGEGSRMALARHGVTDGNATILRPLDSRRSDSEGLLAALDKSLLPGKEVLIIRGENGRELLADALRAAGARVTTVAAYRRSAPVPEAGQFAQLVRLIESSCDWIVTSSEAMRNLVEIVGQAGGEGAVAKMQQQHLLLPHARIAESARLMGFMNITETGSGDEGLLAALQSRP